MRTFIVLGILLLLMLAIAVYGFSESGPFWVANWYNMDSPGEFGRHLLTGIFPFQFQKDWGTGEVIDIPITLFCVGCWRDDYVGFKAQCSFYVHKDQVARFTVAANNGFKLWLDGTLILSSWEELIDGGGYREKSTTWKVTSGPHQLQLDYYEWHGAASVSFSTNLNAFDILRVAQYVKELEAENSSLKSRILKLEKELLKRSFTE